jgi:2-polyprenyl-6-methoxyphenol hydroxylase-like FAD-dependent oxidoreductase
VLVSRTVRDLVAGSGLQFIDRGTHALKGIPDEWRVLAATEVGPMSRDGMEIAEREIVEPQRVLVVGGGIAGLATARGLLQRGIEADVVERAAAWSDPGAGMYLPANSVRALGSLGLQGPLLDHAYGIKRQLFLDQRGRVLLDVDLRGVWGATGPCVAISHRALHELLREGIAIRLGITVTALDDDGSAVQATFADGSTGVYDVVVGADGVHSWVRSAMFGGADATFVGQASWRFLVDGFPEISHWTVLLGRGKAFLTLPLGGGRIYCYADVNAPGAIDPTGGDPAKLAELYHDFAEPVATIAHRLPSDNHTQPHFSPIEEVVHQPWVRGRVVLVGDAAHAMSPNMAEGAGMALEDALVLAETIAGGRPLEEFEARRQPRVAFVQAQTHRRDRTRNLPSFVRKATLRLAGQRIFRGNYKPLLAAP